MTGDLEGEMPPGLNDWAVGEVMCKCVANEVAKYGLWAVPTGGTGAGID
jgi:hypothetical protein